MGCCIVAGGKPDMNVPSAGILLSDIAEGSIVKLNENGSPVEFYVAKHNYEIGLNGAGRTLLARKNTTDEFSGVPFNSNGTNAYANGDMDEWFNGTYKSMLDVSVQSSIGETYFYYTPGNGTTSVTTLKRSIFAPSLAELGHVAPYGGWNAEGEKLPISDALLTIKHSQWTRTPPHYTGTDYDTKAYMTMSDKNHSQAYTAANYYLRPMFTLPSNALFHKTTMLFMGVA